MLASTENFQVLAVASITSCVILLLVGYFGLLHLERIDIKYRAKEQERLARHGFGDAIPTVATSRLDGVATPIGVKLSRQRHAGVLFRWFFYPTSISVLGVRFSDSEKPGSVLLNFAVMLAVVSLEGYMRPAPRKHKYNTVWLFLALSWWLGFSCFLTLARYANRGLYDYSFVYTGPARIVGWEPSGQNYTDGLVESGDITVAWASKWACFKPKRDQQFTYTFVNVNCTEFDSSQEATDPYKVFTCATGFMVKLEGFDASKPPGSDAWPYIKVRASCRGSRAERTSQGTQKYRLEEVFPDFEMNANVYGCAAFAMLTAAFAAFIQRKDKGQSIEHLLPTDQSILT